MISIGIDVTNEYDEKEKMQQMLYAQSKLAMMGEMMGMIIHQYKQPLQHIYMLSQLLAESASEGTISNREVLECTDNINEQVMYLSKTIDDFRDFFKPQQQMYLFSLDKLFLEIKALLKLPFAKQNIMIDVTHEEVSIFGISTELKQVIINLLNNAKDAIIMTRSSSRVVGNIKIKAHVQNANLFITISDNGGGIEPTILEKIFENNFTTKENSGGSGLGLYISKMILEDHFDASISVYNSNDGAIFEIVLPVPIQSL
jgi:signal transduction histidine kinase